MQNQLFSKALLALVSITLACKLGAAPTQWSGKSGDPIEATIFGLHGPYVYLELPDGRQFRFPFRSLSETSQQQAAAWIAQYRQSIRTPKLMSKSESPITALIREHLVTYENRKLQKIETADRTEPEYYAFYYSASWCGPCKRFTPKLSAFYKAMKSAGFDDFELIFVSSDYSTGDMKKYMRESKMPWPALHYNKVQNKLIRKMSGSGIPCLVITDRWGNILQHSYENGEYVGPTKAKDTLLSFLKATRKMDEGLATSNF
ncbi:MAG: thioredoxin-like domain-containing protein [Verrucomicrobiota bacterium]